MNLRDHLIAIRDEHGALTPALVVEAATPAEHPLHHRFEWDDTAAATKFRLVQAAELIRFARVTYRDKADEEQTVRAFVPVRSGDSVAADYVPVEEALADDMSARLVLREFERALARLKAQYGHLREYRSLLESALKEAS